MIRKPVKRNLTVEYQPELIRSLDALKENLDTLDRYLDDKTEAAYSFALERIRRGICFVAVKAEDGYRFYPSRFIGYTDNTMDKHSKNDEKNGVDTNVVISKLLGKPPLPDDALELEYRAYCRRLGFEADTPGTFAITRKYWEFI